MSANRTTEGLQTDASTFEEVHDGGDRFAGVFAGGADGGDDVTEAKGPSGCSMIFGGRLFHGMWVLVVTMYIRFSKHRGCQSIFFISNVIKVLFFRENDIKTINNDILNTIKSDLIGVR